MLCRKSIGRPRASLRRSLFPFWAPIAPRRQLRLLGGAQLAASLQTRTYSDDGNRLDLPSLDKKWRQKWTSTKSKDAEASGRAEYILPMFPYPSGTLHLGHLRVYAIADIMARLRRLQGRDVLLPMGWDSFGLPAENAALERGVSPASWTKQNIRKMKDQLEHMNGSWNWTQEISTCDPEFYKHTQKLFLMLHAKGLAYQAEAEVNYDPVEKTVLANEQVDSEGRSWRSGAKVEKKMLKQWFFKITQLREALLRDLEKLDRNNAWPERVLAMQKNWLGKSTGAMIKFPVMAMGHDMHSAIEVFTTRPDTLFGVQYVALASTHPVVAQLARSDPELQAFLDTLPGLPEDSKVGYLLPRLRVVNPLAYNEATPDATKESIPVYVAPYVLGDYGEGAVMGVPAHDHRDHGFWKEHRYNEPVRVVLAASEDESTTAMLNEPYIEHGVMTANSGPFKGKSSKDVSTMIIAMLEAANLAKPVEKWRLRDWLISRQRYWGTPIPIVHCISCGPVPVPDSDLPVILPDVDGHWEEGKQGNPLESAEDWINTTCPSCKGPAKRDTDTMDTFVDSSWYYARFADPRNQDAPLSPEAASKALPVDLYIGGIEHAILHLLYARFIYKFLSSTSLFPTELQEQDSGAEPFKRLITQGMVHGKTYTDPETGRFLKPEELDLSDAHGPKIKATGAAPNVTFEKMSKSKHNGVDPTEFIGKYGADATRAHMLFQAPVGDVLNWDDAKISGITRWLSRLHHLIQNLAPPKGFLWETATAHLVEHFGRIESMNEQEMAQWSSDVQIWREVQKTIKHVSSAYEDVYSLNTVVSHLMILTNTLIEVEGASKAIQREAASALLRMMAPITPAFAEECWCILHPDSDQSIFESARFPEVDDSAHMLRPRLQACAVQIGGKLKAVVELPMPPKGLEGDELRDWMVTELLRTEEGKAKLSGVETDIRKARRIIVVRGGTLINFVV